MNRMAFSERAEHSLDGQSQNLLTIYLQYRWSLGSYQMDRVHDLRCSYWVLDEPLVHGMSHNLCNDLKAFCICPVRTWFRYHIELWLERERSTMLRNLSSTIQWHNELNSIISN